MGWLQRAEVVKDLGIKESWFWEDSDGGYMPASVFSISLQSGFVMELRLIKDETEITAIKKLGISDQAFHDIWTISR